MNTIKMTILLAPLCGHQSFQPDCYMCRNLHSQVRDLLNHIKVDNDPGHKGVVITLESYEDTSGDTSTRKEKSPK